MNYADDKRAQRDGHARCSWRSRQRFGGSHDSVRGLRRLGCAACVTLDAGRATRATREPIHQREMIWNAKYRSNRPSHGVNRRSIICSAYPQVESDLKAYGIHRTNCIDCTMYSAYTKATIWRGSVPIAVHAPLCTACSAHESLRRTVH